MNIAPKLGDTRIEHVVYYIYKDIGEGTHCENCWVACGEREYLDNLRVNNKEQIISAARKLVDKMEFIHKDPLYKAIWYSAFMHGVTYENGPTYTGELATLKSLLENHA